MANACCHASEPHRERARIAYPQSGTPYGRGSYIGKILEIHQDEPGRIHLILIRQSVGF